MLLRTLKYRPQPTEVSSAIFPMSCYVLMIKIYVAPEAVRPRLGELHMLPSGASTDNAISMHFPDLSPKLKAAVRSL